VSPGASKARNIAGDSWAGGNGEGYGNALSDDVDSNRAGTRFTSPHISHVVCHKSSISHGLHHRGRELSMSMLWIWGCPKFPHLHLPFLAPQMIPFLSTEVRCIATQLQWGPCRAHLSFMRAQCLKVLCDGLWLHVLWAHGLQLLQTGFGRVSWVTCEEPIGIQHVLRCIAEMGIVVLHAYSA
jgi:hypothetical protein